MSRSYKKSRYVTDKSNRNLRARFFKRYVNKSLRNRFKNSEDLLDGSLHKKYGDSYHICDYRYYWSENDAINYYYKTCNSNTYYSDYFRNKYPTLNSWLKYYRKKVVYK